MARRSLLLATLVATLAGAGCASTAPYNPFKIAPDEFYGRIKTIALAPVAVPGDLEDPESVRAKFESLIETKLREAGFTVVPSRDSAKIFEQLNKELGGLFNPLTGKRDRVNGGLSKMIQRIVTLVTIALLIAVGPAPPPPSGAQSR